MPTGIKEWIQQVTDRALEILDLKSDGIPLDDLIALCHAVLSREVRLLGWPSRVQWYLPGTD